MLYIFQVDTGTMLTLDMTLAMESVAKLQKVLVKHCGIPADKQVLLISGGQSLSSMARVCSYSAGTDTNPIFLFSKNTIESATPPSSSISCVGEIELNEQVERSMNLQSSYEAIVTRTQLALRFHELAKEKLKACEKLVHAQHLQHQGWAAVIANLEDITSAFKIRWQSVSEHIHQHLAHRELNIDILNSFSDTVNLLARIPLLGCLVPAFNVSVTESTSSEPDAASALDDLPGPPISLSSPTTLLEWIGAQESKSSLDQMAHQCLDGIQQFEESIHGGLSSEVQGVLDSVNNPSMKEVKGLEDRLYGLEQLMFGAKKLVQEQCDMSQGFLMNQSRARNLKDRSVLPDLCNSHKRQLVVMLKNDQSLRDIYQRCQRAKDELSENLHTRLRWVMYVEKLICDHHNKLIIYHQRLKKLQHALHLVFQMHIAPGVYCKAVLEVVRRRNFANHFFDWSTELCRESKQIHDSEIEKRQAFTSLFKNHFLQALFPGFGDNPPPFAIKAPDTFDDCLPVIKPEDVQFLIKEVPELQDKLSQGADTLEFPHASIYNMTTTSQDSCSQTQDLQNLVLDGSSINVKVIFDNDQDKTELDGRNIVATEPSEPKDTVISSSENKDTKVATVVDNILDIMNLSQSVEVVADNTASGGSDLDLKVDPRLLGPEVTPKVGSTGVTKHPKSKSTPSTSPDMDAEETSEGFQTADFYIDESMPSSLTESAGRKLAELQQVIAEKSYLLDLREHDIEEQRRTIELLQPRLAQAQENFQLLQDVVQKGTQQLRSDLTSMEHNLEREKDEYRTFVNSVTMSIVQTLAKYEVGKIQSKNDELQSLKSEHSEQLCMFEDKFDVESEKVNFARIEIANCEKRLNEALKRIECLKEEHEKEIADLKSEHQENVETVRNQLVLEQEVEMEKMRSDLDLEVLAKDEEIQEMQLQLESKLKEIEQLKKDKISIEETLNENFQKQKDEIQSILNLEFSEKNKELQFNLKKEYEQQLSQEKEKLLKDCEENFTTEKEKLHNHHICDKEKAVQELRTLLENTHKELIDEIKLQMETQKQHELEELRNKIEKDCEEKICEIQLELNKVQNEKLSEISRLETELKEKVSMLETQVKMTENKETSPLFRTSDDDFVSISTRQMELQTSRDSMERTKQEPLIVDPDVEVPHLADICLRPPELLRSPVGTLQAHSNGLRFSCMSGELVDVLYSNIRHAILHSCDGNGSVILHLHLKDAILIGNELHQDVQFYPATSAPAPSHCANEEAVLALRTFLQTVESLPDCDVEFEMLSTDLTFEGTIYNRKLLLTSTKNCLANVTDWPSYLVILNDLEHIHCEKTTLNPGTFDLVLISKDHSLPVQRIQSVDNEVYDDVVKWLGQCEVRHSEGSQLLDWNRIMKIIRDETEQFSERGGWLFLQADKQALKDQRQRYEVVMSRLKQQMEREHQDNLQKVHTSMTVEKQVLFNEALKKLIADHEKELESRDSEVTRLQSELEKLTLKSTDALSEVPVVEVSIQTDDLEGLTDKNDMIESAHSVTNRSIQTYPEEDLEEKQQKMCEIQEELTRARQQIAQLESQLSSAAASAVTSGLVIPVPQPDPALSTMGQAVMGQSVMGQSVMPVAEFEGRILTLQATLKSKEDEVSKLQSRIMEFSMSSSCRGLVQDKVSITSCNVGDLVLLCLDDQRANYVVFTVTNLLHFLHSEYLEILGLKTAPGESKKSWVLAEVIDKEYCQAKKPQNRYNVPVGTKFYRIKARPWSREAALQHYQTPRTSDLHTTTPQPQQQPSACDNAPQPTDS